MTVVLSVLLAMIAALFILRTSVDSVGTLSVADDKELRFAVETVVGQLNNQLTLDVPNVATPSQEYQDYPWANSARGPYVVGTGVPVVATFNKRQGADSAWLKDDRWLASLEPYKNIANGNYYWSHISDLYGDRRWYDSTGSGSFPDATTDIFIDPASAVIADAAPINKAAATDLMAKPPLADADGDGVVDAIWMPIRAEIATYDYTYLTSYTPVATTIVPAQLRPDENKYLRSGKGKQFYVALRVVDLGGMLNANTGYQFYSTSTVASTVDGSSVMQTNLFGLAKRGSGNTIGQLEGQWQPGGLTSLSNYQNNVVWKLDKPAATPYTPFDITEELKLRYRYILNRNAATTRMDSNAGMNFWNNVWELGPTTPWEKSDSITAGKYWLSRVDASLLPASNYDFRHITTTYNCDRLFAPDGTPQLNLNDASTTAQKIYDQLVKMDAARVAAGKTALNPDLLAQLAVNIQDYRDGDGTPTALAANSTVYYGHSNPFVWISEVAFSQTRDLFGVYRCYAIEYYAPDITGPPATYRLLVDGVQRDIFILSGWTNNYRVLLRNDPSSTEPLPYDPAAVVVPSAVSFNEGAVLTLQRLVGATWVPVDHWTLPTTGWSVPDTAPISMQRDIVYHHCMYRQWSPFTLVPTLGATNSYTPTFPPMQYDTPGGNYVTIGDVGRVLAVATDASVWYSTVPPDEAAVRFNWGTIPDMEEFPLYFTVMKQPYPASERDKVFGRININTAPAFVLAQLPWVSDRQKMIVDGADPLKLAPSPWSSTKLAEAIVAYRDKRAIAGGPDYTNRNTTAPSLLGTGLTGLRNEPGFASIAELDHVVTSAAARTATPALTEWGMDWYSTDMDPRDTTKALDQPLLPDLSAADSAANDFEERDLIFSRISNIATVRSDVFCAYILVRLGEDGPQKRFIAILDRSDVSKSNPSGKVKIRALQPVADPR